MIQINNFLTKREQSQACLSFAKREKSRLLAKTILTLVALLALTTGAWAETGENIFQYCYDCQRYPAYPKTTASAELSGFTNPLVGYKGSGSGMGNTSAGPWKLEYVGLWSTTDNHGIEDFRVRNYQDTYNCTDVPVFRLYQWNATANEYQHASYGVVCCYAKVSNAVEHTALFEAADGWGCVLTNSSHSSSMDITFDEDLTTGLTTLTAAATPAASGTPVPVTWDATTKTSTFTMPAGNVLLQVEYYEDPGLAWKGKIPEGGFDAYLGFFHPSALPTIKNPNALTGITYSSSNTAVATVDENTGVVTALKAGSTVITATFAGDDTYEAAAISYTLNINSPAIITLPTSTDEGGTVTLVAGAASEAHNGDNKIATNANLDRANTSRNIAVGDDGTIHVVYKNTESDAVMYKKSTDGVTFSEPVQVSAESGTECEVAVSSNGKVYVSYTTTTGSGGYIAYSADGSSFTSVQVCSGYANSIHLAVDGDYVYGIPQNGFEFYYSADGGQNYATHTDWTNYVFSDVLIDKSNNNVVVIKDEPSVVVRYSTDHGATFTEEQPVMNGADQLAVSFSTAAAGAGKVFISGIDGTIATVNYINATCTQTTIEKTENRSLCADENENVIVGVEQNDSLYYELSTDGAQTFGEKVLVSEGSSANAALNHHDGSLLYLFTKGTDLYLATKTGVVSTETVIDNGDGTYTVMPGTEVTLIAKANDGYHVASWSNSVEVNDPQEATQTITVTGNLNITATFAENEYNITFVEGTNPDPENPEWTATPNPAKTKQTVTVTYTGSKKVLGVKAEKKASTVPVTAITLNKTATTITMISGTATETLSVTAVTPDEATDKTYTWSSDDITKATVDQNGVVTAVAEGTAHIRATANDGSGVYGECTVTVSDLSAYYSNMVECGCDMLDGKCWNGGSNTFTGQVLSAAQAIALAQAKAAETSSKCAVFYGGEMGQVKFAKNDGTTGSAKFYYDASGKGLTGYRGFYVSK